LRLERIGDLLMALPGIADIRALAPAADIDLVVGSWNQPIARQVSVVTRVLTLDARWLAREREGLGIVPLLRQARRWRARQYDLAINFEPDIRSNLLLAASGAAWTAGFASGGGGPVLDDSLHYDLSAHTSDNARRLVAHVFRRRAPETGQPLLNIPETASRGAVAKLSPRGRGLLVALHASGGRAIKQWDPARFAEVARRLVDEQGATIVLTGAAGDRPLVEIISAALPSRRVIDLAGEVDLLELLALLQQVDLLITGDTGPMHMAAVVGTPVVAVFGPSDPVRYAPRGPADRIVRVDLPCSPCNRIRLPPVRCVGHTPDCLVGVAADRVYDAALAALEASGASLRTALGNV
jgi:ADP-heptose:LPS heptosyltransferase